MNQAFDFSGKLIGIIGSPGSGKTFLTKQFSALDNVVPLYEDDLNFPPTILNNLKNQVHLFETIVWFRNRQVEDTKRAIELTSKGLNVVLDSTLYQYQLYIDLYIKDEFYRATLKEMAFIDNQAYGKIDVIIYLSSTKDLVVGYLRSKGEDWPLNTPTFIEFLSPMADYCEQFVIDHSSELGNLIKINRKEFDFANQADLMRLMTMINRFF